jgi:hypothetical protein
MNNSITSSNSLLDCSSSNDDCHESYKIYYQVLSLQFESDSKETLRDRLDDKEKSLLKQVAECCIIKLKGIESTVKRILDEYTCKTNGQSSPFLFALLNLIGNHNNKKYEALCDFLNNYQHLRTASTELEAKQQEQYFKIANSLNTVWVFFPGITKRNVMGAVRKYVEGCHVKYPPGGRKGLHTSNCESVYQVEEKMNKRKRSNDDHTDEVPKGEKYVVPGLPVVMEGQGKWRQSDVAGTWTAVTDKDYFGVATVEIVNDSTMKFNYYREESKDDQGHSLSGYVLPHGITISRDMMSMFPTR